MTALEVSCMLCWVATVDAKYVVPAVRDRNKVWIDDRAKSRDDAGQWIVEVFIFATPETMSFHHDTAAEKIVLREQPGYRFGFIGGKKTFDDRVTFRVEFL